MARSQEQTRRGFLIRLARTAAFVPPLMATWDVRPLSAQGKTTTTGGGGGGGNGGKGNGGGNNSTIGSLSPTAQVVSSPTFNLQGQNQSTVTPWAPGQSSQPPPWSRPPPTQTGR